MHIKTANISVEIDGSPVYESVKYDEKFFGKTAGSYFVKIPVRLSDSGKEIRITVDNPYNDGGGKITKIYLGAAEDILSSETGDILPGFLVCVTITFLGVLFLVMFIPMWKNKAVGTELLYFALFTINIGTFMLTDCKFLHILFPNAHFYHMIAEIHMMLIVVPLFLFLNKMYSTCTELMVYCICIMGSFDFVSGYLLNISCTMDYHQSLWITHITYGIAILFALIVIIKGIFKDRRAHMYHNMGIIIMCVAAIVDIVLIKFSNAFETSFFTRIGVLIYICLEGIQIFMGFFKRYREGMKAQLLSNLAYHDGLTELLNRTSFMEDINNIEKAMNSEIIVAMFDVNDLKKANDNYGHAAGDNMIKLVAEELKNHFGDYGKCYRIGGDEFVFISDGKLSEQLFTETADKLMQTLADAEKDEKFIFPITVAMGYSVADRSTMDMSGVIDDADAKMYENKKLIKQKKLLAENA
ncbi:MAG: diguanylate cyclase [Oscillospiraceae bacterium]|nr:diguanylate cyclase [Oscillospiraceae bacterium]